MVRAVNRNFNLWLAGYYDDFMNCRAIPDDRNEPSETNSYSSIKSHHGNTMNGEALLNPRYRLSYPDRAGHSSVLNSISDISLNDVKYSKNSSIADWLSADSFRNNWSTWSGKAQLQYPDGHIANRIRKFDNQTFSIGSDMGYQLFCNGNNTNSFYLVPTGQYDPTFGRSVMEAFQTSDGGGGVGSTNYANKKAGVFETVTGGEADILNQQAHLTGVWSGETLSLSHNDSGTITPTNSFFPIKSPDGKPFLSIRRFETLDGGSNAPDHDDIPSIIYDGSLNSKLDDDVFHLRFGSRCFSGDVDATNTLPPSGSTQSFTNGELPTRIEVKIGYASTAQTSEVTSSAGLTGTHAECCKIFLGVKEDGAYASTNGIFHHTYDCYGANYLGNSAQTYSNDSAWIDLDVRMDYTNQKFYVYINGTNKTPNGIAFVNTSFGGSITADKMYGWEATQTAFAINAAQGGSLTYLDKEAISYLLLDRAGLVHYITDDLEDKTWDITLNDLSLDLNSDSVSQMRITIEDDPTEASGGTSASNYIHHLKPLFSSSNPVDWQALLFASEEDKRIDRPVWRGVVDRMVVKQKENARLLQLKATHNASLLNRQIPLWDVGQVALDDTVDNATPYWLYDAQSLKNVMDMGTRHLKICDSKLGFDKTTNYLVTNEQRMQLGSGHPIQMYNNEDTFGPNNAERDWEGEQVLGYFKAADTAKLYGPPHGGSGTVRNGVALSLASGYTAGGGSPTDVTIDGETVSANFNFSNKDLLAKGPIGSGGSYTNTHIASGGWYNDVKEWLLFATGDWTYTPESSKIVYMGKHNGGPFTSQWYNNYRMTENMDQWDMTVFWEETIVANYPNNHAETLGHTSDNLTIIFDADPQLAVGDYFYVNHINDADEINENADGSSAGNMSPLPGHYKGRHKVKSTKRILNYFRDAWTGASTANPPTSYVWVIETWSGLELGASDFEGNIGLWFDPSAGGNATNTDALLSGNDRFSWVRSPVGKITPNINPNQVKATYRNNHARYMRDLPNSLWFQYHFGIIKTEPAAQNHSDTDIMAGYDKPAARRYLSTRTGNVLGDISKGSQSIKISTDLYTALLAQGRHSGVGEIRAEGYWAYNVNVPDFVGTDSGTQPNKYCKFIWQGLVADGGDRYLVGCKYIDADFTTNVGGANTGTLYGVSLQYNNRIWVVPLDFEDDYKHLWILWADMRNDGQADADGGKRKDKFGLMYPVADQYKPTIYLTDQTDPETGALDKYLELEMPNDAHIWDVSGYDPLRKTTYTTLTGGSFSRPVNYATNYGSSNGGSSVAYDNGGKLAITDISTSNLNALAVKDWVHISNSDLHDGTYQVDAKDTSNNRLTLKATYLGSDNGSFGGIRVSPTTADSLTMYRDWEETAGAMCIIDCSPFFNLNTHANGGRAYAEVGGRTDLIDYVWEKKGAPKLQDNYWEQAISSFKTTGEEFSKHPNWRRLISDATFLDASVNIDDKYIIPQDGTIFPNEGVGRIYFKENQPIEEGSEETEEVLVEHYFLWNSKQELEQTGTDSTINMGNSVITSGINGTTYHKLTATGPSVDDLQGVAPGMVIVNTSNNPNTVHNIWMRLYDSNDFWIDNASEWTNGDDWKIPVQLGGVWTTTEPLLGNIEATYSGLEDEVIQRHIDAGYPRGSTEQYRIKTNDTQELNTDYDYEEVYIASTVSNQYSLRTMMHLEGKVESEATGTFYDSDKIRTLWNLGIARTWLPNTNLNCMVDINNVPLTLNLTTDGGNTNLDSYGSVMAGSTRTILNQVKEIQNRSGLGVNSKKTTFSWLGGRDNRLEYRPKFNSGVAFNRNNVKISNYSTDSNAHITNVRVYYNESKSFVDYPKPGRNDTTRWKVLEYPEIRLSKEAEGIAKQEYNGRKTTNSALTIEPNTQYWTEDNGTTRISNQLFDKGRYGYIADQTVALQGNNDDGVAGAWSWTRLGTGGCLFPGAVNALDGNLGVTGTFYNRYGTSLGADKDSSADVNWSDNFFWYGSNSISNAVQIVHVPTHCPLVSEQTGQDMRMFVTLMGGQATDTAIEDCIFQVFLIDYLYTGASRAASINTGTFTASNRVSSVQCQGSGYYELPIPESYWNNNGSAWSDVPKLTFSFNAEYCRELLRQRCGDPASVNIYKNANTLTGIGVGTGNGQIETGNANSIFPLGGKEHRSMYMFMDNACRLEWYAPRLVICRDMAYSPASYVKYTDAGLGYTDETFNIKGIKYDMKHGSEKLMLSLVKDESLRSGIINAFLESNRLEPSIIEQPTEINIPPPSGSPGVDSWTPPIFRPGGGGAFNPIGDGGKGGGAFTLDLGDSKLIGIINRNRLDLSDNLSFGRTLNYLGQKIGGPGAIGRENMKDGKGVNMKSKGAGIVSKSGYTFVGKGGESDSSASALPSSFTTESVIGQGAVGEIVRIDAKVTHAPASTATTGIAELTIKVTCVGGATPVTVTRTKKLPAGLNQKEVNLFNARVQGANVPGRNLIIEILRTAGTGNDTSNFNSVTISDVRISQQTSRTHSTRNMSSRFRPY